MIIIIIDTHVASDIDVIYGYPFLTTTEYYVQLKSPDAISG